MGFPVYLVAVDELASFSATVGTAAQQKEINACNRDVIAPGRAASLRRPFSWKPAQSLSAMVIRWLIIWPANGPAC